MNPDRDPIVGVLRDPYQVGAGALRDAAPFVTRLPLSEALAREWLSEACLVGYSVEGEGFAQQPRLRKLSPILSEIRSHGGDVVLTTLCLDFDTPGHKPWKGRDEIDAAIRDLEHSTCPYASKWAAFYTTRRGFRLVFKLATPMPVDTVEPHIRGVIQAFQADGWTGETKCKADPACDSWEHLFRAPKIVRNGKMTSTEDYFELLCIDETLDLGSVAPANKSGGAEQTGYVYVEREERDQPEGECFDLLYTTDQSGAMVPSQWVREAKRRLRGRRCFPALFEYAPFAEPGARDSTLQKLVGEAVSVLFQAPGATPEGIYSLFLAPIRQLDPDAGTPDWTEALWRAVMRYWNAERAKDEWRKTQNAVRVENVQSRMGRMIDGARLWAPSPQLHADDAQATEWLSRHLIAVNNGHVWVMGQDGRYDAHGIRPEHLPLKIRELGQENVLPLTAVNSQDKVVVVKPQQLLDRHGTLVRAVEGVAGGDGSHIRGVDTDRQTLILRLYRRKTSADLEPAFNADVDEWLTRLGGSDAGRLKAWIGHALDFEGGPICALSISGSAGIGKKLLLKGLAETIDTESFADPTVFGQYQGRLKGTPFLWLNEGVSREYDTLADSFRRYTGGDPILVNEKYEVQMQVNAPLRVLITTNNTDIVSLLTGHRDMTPDDRESIAIRLLHIDATRTTAAAWLRSRGGLGFTGRPGARWVGSDAGAASDYVVARHFLHLYEVRPAVERGARLLMEGRLDDETMQEMVVRGGVAPAVVEALCRMIERPAGGMGISVDAKSGSVHVTNAGVVEYHRLMLAAVTGVRLNHLKVGQVLRGLATRAGTIRKTLLDSAGKPTSTYWTELDLSLLLHEARVHGYPCTQIERLLQLAFVEENKSSMTPTPIQQRIDEVREKAASTKLSSIFKRVF